MGEQRGTKDTQVWYGVQLNYTYHILSPKNINPLFAKVRNWSSFRKFSAWKLQMTMCSSFVAESSALRYLNA